MKIHALTVLLSLIAVQGAAAAENGRPICSEPAVLDEVQVQLRQAGRPLLLEASPIGEIAAGLGRVVHCAIRGHMPGYDTTRHGMQPIDDLFVVNYTLELRRNGIFLRLQQ